MENLLFLLFKKQNSSVESTSSVSVQFISVLLLCTFGRSQDKFGTIEMFRSVLLNPRRKIQDGDSLTLGVQGPSGLALGGLKCVSV